MDKYILEIIAGVAGIAITLLTPYVKNALQAIEAKAKAEIGEKNYNYALDFIKNEYKLHADLFADDKITGLIEQLVVKFGAKISEDTIKKIVDLVIAEGKTAA